MRRHASIENVLNFLAYMTIFNQEINPNKKGKAKQYEKSYLIWFSISIGNQCTELFSLSIYGQYLIVIHL